MAGKFEDVSKVYSLCIMDFVIYNQLNEVYNLQISTRYCTVIRSKNEPHNNINAKLEIRISDTTALGSKFLSFLKCQSEVLLP